MNTILPVLRITRKFVPVEGSATWKVVWLVQEHVRIHMWPWPKTWITRSQWDSFSDALMAYGEVYAAS